MRSSTHTFVVLLVVAFALVWAFSTTYGQPRGASGPVRPAVKTKHVSPVYSRAACEAGIRGGVEIEVTIGPDGKVKETRVLRSVPELEDAALAAVNQWEFAPAAADGVPLPSLMTVIVNFSPPEKGHCGSQASNPPTTGSMEAAVKAAYQHAFGETIERPAIYNNPHENCPGEVHVMTTGYLRASDTTSTLLSMYGLATAPSP